MNFLILLDNSIEVCIEIYFINFFIILILKKFGLNMYILLLISMIIYVLNYVLIWREKGCKKVVV